MPMYDFQCATHGTFEAMSRSTPNGVESVRCPRCGELAPIVWRRSPAMRNDGVEAVIVGGKPVPMERIERELADRDETPDFWDEPGFEKEWLDKRDEKVGKWMHGDLPPMELTDAEIAVVKDGMGVK